ARTEAYRSREEPSRTASAPMPSTSTACTDPRVDARVSAASAGPTSIRKSSWHSGSFMVLMYHNELGGSGGGDHERIDHQGGRGRRAALVLRRRRSRLEAHVRGDEWCLLRGRRLAREGQVHAASSARRSRRARLPVGG